MMCACSVCKDNNYAMFHNSINHMYRETYFIMFLDVAFCHRQLSVKCGRSRKQGNGACL